MPLLPSSATSDEHPRSGTTELVSSGPLVGVLIVAFPALETFVFHGALSEQLVEVVFSWMG